MNRLRERTGIIVQGFAGIGFFNSKTRANLLDDSGFGTGGTPYDYSTINTTAGSVVAEQELDLLRDNSYETDVDGSADRQVKIMPTVGLNLGISDHT